MEPAEQTRLQIVVFPSRKGRRPSERTGQDIGHFACRLSLGGGSHVGVGVQGESGTVMAQHTGDGLDVHAVFQRYGCESVTVIVASYLFQLVRF